MINNDHIGSIDNQTISRATKLDLDFAKGIEQLIFEPILRRNSSNSISYSTVFRSYDKCCRELKLGHMKE